MHKELVLTLGITCNNVIINQSYTQYLEVKGIVHLLILYIYVSTANW